VYIVIVIRVVVMAVRYRLLVPPNVSYEKTSNLVKEKVFITK